MMHGRDFFDFPTTDPTGWIVTEKFDGFFARWTGSTLLTREGHDYNAPAWFLAGLPRCALDCELFAGYGRREFLNSADRWRDKSRWRCAELVAFDAPEARGGYEVRRRAINVCERLGLRVAKRWTCSGDLGLVESLAVIAGSGGEGLVIRHPDAPYAIGKVQTMLKVKPHMFT
jgi:DNA ligase-1